MNKKEALEFLNQKLAEIGELILLPANNSQYPVWRKNIASVLKEVFGSDSAEYKAFNKTYTPKDFDGKLSREEFYQEVLRKREIDIICIISKHSASGN